MTYRFAVLGAGAMGSIIGAHLIRAGHDVAVIARGGRAAQLEKDGLRIEGLSEISVPVRVLRSPSQLSGAEVLVVATKTMGSMEALRQIPADTVETVMSIQNGLEKYDILGSLFGAPRVVGALANTSGELLTNGSVLFTRNLGIAIGELQGHSSGRTQRIAREIDASGVSANSSDNILGVEWSKFCAWAGMMVMAVVSRSVTWKYMSDPDCARIIAQLVCELGSLARALGIELTDNSVLPVASIAAANELFGTRAVMQAGESFRTHAPTHRMSALQDIEAGRPLEIEATLGYAHRKAVELGLQLPQLDAAYHLVAGIDRVLAHDHKTTR